MRADRSDENIFGLVGSLVKSVVGGGSTAAVQGQSLQTAMTQQAAAQGQTQAQSAAMFAAMDKTGHVALPKRPGLEESPVEVAPVQLDKIVIDMNSESSAEDALYQELKRLLKHAR